MGLPVGSGAPEAGYENVPFTVQWTAGLLAEQRPTPGKPEIRQDCWSRGRIVSALLAAGEGGCLPSMEPPNRAHTPSDERRLAAGIDADSMLLLAAGVTGLHESDFTEIGSATG